MLDELLEEVGLARGEVFVANVLKCLRYTSQVQLGDGSWERIGRLVRSRYAGDVMSVNGQGELVPRRVVGWHATPLGGRTVHRMTFRAAKPVGPSGVNVELTGDHPVLTERGYVRVDQLESGDRVATGQGLSALAHDISCGTLLGDGSINARSSFLSFGHSEKQAEYAAFKQDLLAELQPRLDRVEVAAVAGGLRQHGAVLVRTRAHRALRILHADFYTPTKVVPGWLAEALNERMLAIWFMDDGHMRIRPPRRPSAEIATNGFAERDRRVLQNALLRLGLPARVGRGRLHFDVFTTEALSERIAPYVPPSMRHKLHPDVEARTPFDPHLLAAGPPQVMYDDVEVEDITEKPRGDTTFFCIDVQGTHNFVTAGGVVHNCRPPGNRDPQPEEIDTCRPYLDRQVELIEPKVICTLGNFSTKLLTRSSAGITRVRGKPQVHELGGRAVRIFPILHPAAGLRTPSVKQQLREDFARLPGLLAEPPPPQPGAPAAPEPERAPPADAEPEQLGLL